MNVSPDVGLYLRQSLERKDSPLKPFFTFPKNLLEALISVQDAVSTWPVFPAAYTNATARLREYYDRKTYRSIPKDSGCVPSTLRLDKLMELENCSEPSAKLSPFWQSSRNQFVATLKRKRS